MPKLISTLDKAVDLILSALPPRIVLGLPLGIGKPNPLVNALYRRVKADPTRQLEIFTALSLERPVGSSELEQRFLAPFVERVFGNYPDLDYVKDLRAETLPPNIQVSEFFFKTGDYLGNPTAQQHYISTNYTFVARDMVERGVNLLLQAVAVREVDGSLRLSLSGNTDVTFEMRERLRASGRTCLLIGAINRELPFMPNQAEVTADFFDAVVTDPANSHTLFGAPNMSVSLQDYAIGLHASSLVADGGTLQIGIGSLGDAIAQALIVRDQANDDYRALLAALCQGDTGGRELLPFQTGLYGASEMFVNGFLRLIEAGIVRRPVYGDATLQRLLDAGAISETVGTDSLRALREAGRIGSPLSAGDLAFLQRFGIVSAGLSWRDGQLSDGARSFPADIDSIPHDSLGTRLRGGIVMHGGFFLGPQDFYQRLRELPEETLAQIEMHRIDFLNQLYGHDELARVQRRQARFMNTTMMVTLLGAAVSDALDNGAVVSGVGGQYNFVAMAHALPDARSVLMLRATRESQGKVQSNIVWNYAHTTIPRHLRDLVVTEYGIADLRGQTDAEVVRRLIAIADARFQDELADIAKRNGKLPADYQVPESARNNLPDTLTAALAPWRQHLPPFPFGTDLTPDELKMVAALRRLKQATENPLELAALAWRSLFSDHDVPAEWLERLGLAEPHDLKTLITRRLFIGNL